MSDIPFNELCALEPYTDRKKDIFTILRGIGIERAGQICLGCPLRVECNPDMIKVSNEVYVRKDE